MPDQPTISFPIISAGKGHGTHSYNTWEAMSPAFWASNKPSKNYSNMEVQFGTGSKAQDDDESGCIRSTPLWNNANPPRSPRSRRNHYRSLSPESKTKAVARGQSELMEMVSNMPDSTYELSLKDLVEHPRVVEVGEENRNLSKNNALMRGGGTNSRSGKIDGAGFYLKLVFPSYLVSKKKKNKKDANAISKVSPRSSVSDVAAKGLVDKEWCKKRHSVSSGESDSGGSSINSGSTKSTGSSSSSRSNNSRHEIIGSSCWPFLRRLESI